MATEEKGYLIEHMKMTQDIISRMNRNSFQLKGWMLTIVAAFLALYGHSANKSYIWIAIAPTIVFWLLDSFYLREERKYVAIYENLVKLFNGKEALKQSIFFDFSLKNCEGSRYNFFAVMFSKTELLLYLTVIVMLIIAGKFSKLSCSVMQ